MKDNNEENDKFEKILKKGFKLAVVYVIAYIIGSVGVFLTFVYILVQLLKKL